MTQISGFLQAGYIMYSCVAAVQEERGPRNQPRKISELYTKSYPSLPPPLPYPTLPVHRTELENPLTRPIQVLVELLSFLHRGTGAGLGLDTLKKIWPPLFILKEIHQFSFQIK